MQPSIRHTTFRNGGAEIAAHLHLPAGFDPGRSYAAVVCVHPGSGVKEQTAGIYAARLAGRGFVALAFDASCQGESGGEPRYAEEPAARVEDVRCAVDFLTTLEYVGPGRIGVLGVCAGGGYAVSAAMTDHRISAVGTVVGVNIGRARREGDGSPGAALALLGEIGAQRTAEARGEPPLITPWTPAGPKEARAAGVTDVDALEAVDYYRTPRGRHDRSPNRLRFTSNASVLAFDAFHLAEELLTQPLQIVVGGRQGGFGSYRDGHELFRRAAGEKDLLVVEGATHYDLYDRPAYVGQAVEQLAAFYAGHLADAR